MFSDHFNEYFERGLVVIPLRGKIPVIKNWSLFAQKRPSNLLIDLWGKKYPRNNIGLLTGKLSGIIAIDIDKDSALKLVPPSPFVKKGKKGETRFFKYNGEINFKRHDLGIELLSDGNQTVLPPSIHPETGKPYVWNGLYSLIDGDIDELPDLDKDFYKKTSMIPVERGTETSGRHNKLIEICSSMIGRGEDPTSIVEELMKYDEENHPDPYFYDKSEPHGGTGFNAALQMYASVSQTIQRRGGDPSPKKIEIAIGESEIERIIKEEDKKAVKIKASFPEPPGMIKEIRDYILDASHKPRVGFATASAMSLIGVVSSNKVRYKSSTPNLYQLLIADSGEGKDVPLKAPKKVLIKAGLLRYIGLDSYRGDKSVVKKFEGQRERIDTLDEVSKLFRSINSRNNSFQSNIAETLTELWNSSHELFMGHTTSEGTTGMVFNPCLSIMGATTPNSFSETFSSSNIMQGFGGRFVYHFDDSRVELRMVDEKEPSEKILKFLEYWGKMKVKIEHVDISETQNFQVDFTQKKPELIQMKKLACPQPTDLPIQPEAYEYLIETMKYFDELKHHSDFQVIPIILRAFQQTQKIMILSAVSTSEIGNPSPIIKLSDVEFARKYVEATIENTATFFNQSLIESKFHRDSQTLLRVLKQSPKGLTRKELTRKMINKFKSHELYDKKSGIVSNLIEAGVISAYEVKKEGSKKAQTIFVAQSQKL